MMQEGGVDFDTVIANPPLMGEEVLPESLRLHVTCFLCRLPLNIHNIIAYNLKMLFPGWG